MSSREEIIARIQKVGLEEKPLPSIPVFDTADELVGQYRQSLEANHALLIECKGDAEAAIVLEGLAAPYSSVISRVPQFTRSTLDLATISYPSDLHQVELAIVEADLGVAENGAHWLPEEKLQVRALPFIVLHLAIVLRKDKLVANMHEAYNRIGKLPGFGSFIAGPSKTADIEQALVIGAHGPKSLVVVLVS